MKPRLLLIALLLLIASGVMAQNKPLQSVDPTIGIGRLQISLNDSIPLYKSADDIRAFDTLVFSRIADGADRGKFTMSTKTKLNIAPFVFQPGDSYDEAAANVAAGVAYHHPVLIFKVTSLVKGGFEIVINDKTFETCVIKKDRKHTLYTNGTPYWTLNHSSEASASAWFLYEAWSNYLKRLVAVNVVNPKIYDNPEGSLILLPEGNISFQPVYVIEQWLKVRLTGKQQKDGIRDEVWIKWTDGKNLLVTPIEEVYY